MKRSRLEIMAGIMQNCLLPRPKTRIMYEGNLSFAQINAYLNLVISLGLLAHEEGKYRVTDKGLQFLSAYNQLSEIIGTSKPPVTEMKFFLNSPPSPSSELSNFL